MTFALENDVPLPKRTAPGGRRGSKYPFAQMEVGQSFRVSDDTKAATIRSAVGAFSKRYSDAGKFAVRVTDEGIRVWRTA
jgi:hypothetical protein